MRTLISLCIVGFCAVISCCALAQETAKKVKAPAKESPWVTNDENGVKVLITYLNDKDEFVVCTGLDALARMGALSKLAVPAILQTLKHEKWSIRIEAARTLIDLNIEMELAHKTLGEALETMESEGRVRLALRLGNLVNPPTDYGICCWGPGPRPNRPVRPEFHEPAIKFLTSALKDKEPNVRILAANSLGRIGSKAKSAVPALLDALDDKEPKVRQAAADAARRIVTSASIEKGAKVPDSDYLLQLIK